jgi:hypothetical protein
MRLDLTSLAVILPCDPDNDQGFNELCDAPGLARAQTSQTKR